MQIHGYNDHFHRYEKNPFLGEDLRVFMAGGPEDGTTGEDDGEDENAKKNAEDMRAKEAKQGNDKFYNDFVPPTQREAYEKVSPFVLEIEKLVPSKLPYAYNSLSKDGKIEHKKGRKHDVEEKWSSVMTEYNGMQSYIDHFTKLKEKVEKPDFDPRSPRWQARMGKIYTRVDEELEVLKRSGVDIPKETIDKIHANRDKEFNAEKGEVIEDLRQIITNLYEARKMILDKMEEQMRNDFNSRLEWLKEKWQKDPPPGYEGVAPNYVSIIEDARGRIRDLPALMEGNPETNFQMHHERIKEYQAIWDDIDRFEDKYTYATESQAAAGEYSVEKLEAEYQELVDLQRTTVTADFVKKYKEETEATMRDLIELIAKVERYECANEKEEAERDLELKALRMKLGTLEANKDIGRISLRALDDSSPMMEKDKDGNPTHAIWVSLSNGRRSGASGRSGTAIPMPNGLKQQIEMLKILPLNEAEQKQFALGIHEAFERYKKEIQSTADQLAVFQAMRGQIKLQTQHLEPEQIGGDGFKINWIAMYDATRVYETITQWAGRRYQRAATQRTGLATSQLLKPLNKAPWPLTPLRTLPNEFDKTVEQSEQEEVNQYKEVYTNKDMWEVEQIAYHTKNADELKACLYLLAERGRLRWDRIALLKQFNHFQSGPPIRLDIEYHLSDLGAFHDKLHRALGNIWDFDTYKQLKSQNSSAYDSKKGEYEQNCHEWAERPGGLGKVAVGMITAYEKYGEDAKIDPVLYEKIIDYGIKYGKMGPEQKLQLLIKGIASGLLSLDRGSALNSVYINDYPVIDYFGSPTRRAQKPIREDLIEVASLDDVMFKDWYHRVAMTLPRVIQRVQKTLTQGNKLDHDDLTASLMYMGEQTTETMLKAHTDGYRLPQTGVENATVAMDHYIRHLAENQELIKNRNPELFRSEMQRFIGSFTRFNGILTSRMYQKQDFFRWDASNYNNVPRQEGNYANMFGQSGNTAKQNMENVQKYLSIIDPEFFGALFNPNFTDKNVAGLVKTMKERPENQKPDGTAENIFGDTDPKDLNELHTKTSEYMAYLLGKYPDKIQQMLNTVAADNQTAYHHYENVEVGTSIPERRKRAEAKLEDLQEQFRTGRRDWDPNAVGNNTVIS